MKKRPKVSVVTISYNQDLYIRETLESIVHQETEFEFEAIVADDGSSDGTASIISEYASKYPNIIKPILRKKNIGAYENFLDAFKQATGDYIALCEGDDYWTDMKKLQMQVNFLDTNKEYALCFHPVRVFFDKKEQPDYVYPDASKKDKFTVLELLHDNFIQTNTVMYRRQRYDKLPADIMPADWYLHLFHAQFGKIGFIDEVMAAYRRHSESLWWNTYKNKSAFWKKHGFKHLDLHREFLKLYGENEKYKKAIYESAFRAIVAFEDIYHEGDEQYLNDATKNYPEFIEGFLISQQARINELHDVLTAHKEELKNTQQALELKENHIQNLEGQLNRIHKSKAWKVASKARSLNSKIKRP